MTQPTRTENLRLGDSRSSHLANGPLEPLTLKAAAEVDFARTLLPLPPPSPPLSPSLPLPTPPPLWEEPVTTNPYEHETQPKISGLACQSLKL